MKRILVPIDGSATSLKALDVAVALAKLTQASITLFTAIPEHTGGFPEASGVDTNPAVATARYAAIAEAEACCKNDLATLIEQHKHDGVAFDYSVSVGIVDDQIVRLAEQNNYDLIVIGRRGLNPLQRIFIGSVTQRVIAHAPCSVLVVKEDEMK